MSSLLEQLILLCRRLDIISERQFTDLTGIQHGLGGGGGGRYTGWQVLHGMYGGG